MPSFCQIKTQRRTFRYEYPGPYFRSQCSLANFLFLLASFPQVSTLR